MRKLQRTNRQRGKRMVWVVRYEHRFGDDHFACATEAKSYAKAAEIIFEWQREIEDESVRHQIVGLIRKGLHKRALGVWTQYEYSAPRSEFISVLPLEIG